MKSNEKLSQRVISFDRKLKGQVFIKYNGTKVQFAFLCIGDFEQSGNYILAYSPVLQKFEQITDGVLLYQGKQCSFETEDGVELKVVSIKKPLVAWFDVKKKEALDKQIEDFFASEPEVKEEVKHEEEITTENIEVEVPNVVEEELIGTNEVYQNVLSKLQEGGFEETEFKNFRLLKKDGVNPILIKLKQTTIEEFEIDNELSESTGKLIFRIPEGGTLEVEESSEGIKEITKK